MSLDPENIAVRVGDAGEWHARRVLAALENAAAGVLHVPDGIIELDRVIDVEPDVLGPTPGHLSVMQDSDRAVGSRDAHEDYLFVPEDLLQLECFTVEADRLIQISYGYYEEQRGYLGH